MRARNCMSADPDTQHGVESKKKKKQKKMTVGYGILLLFVPFLCLLFNPFFYDYLHEKHGSYDTLGHERVQEIRSDVFSFLLLQQNSIDAFTAEENSHMKDVRLIIVLLILITVLSYILLLRRLLFDSRLTTKHEAALRMKRYLLHLESAAQSARYLAGAIVFLAVCVVLFFEQTFTMFHLLLFPQGNWLFDASSIMIQTFPAGFFMEFSLWWFGIVLFLCCSIVVATWFVCRHSKAHHKV